MITMFLLLVLCVAVLVKAFGIDEVNDKVHIKSWGAYLLALVITPALPIECLERFSNGWDTPSYYGSIVLHEITGKSNQSILAESPSELWLDITTQTTLAERKEAAFQSWKANCEKAEAIALAKKMDDIREKLHTPDTIVSKAIKGYDFVVSNPSLRIIDHYSSNKGLGHIKVEEWIRIYENKNEYLVLFEGGKKMIFPKNNFMKENIKENKDLTIIYDGNEVNLGGYNVNVKELTLIVALNVCLETANSNYLPFKCEAFYF